jgi:hypothetical protein
MAGIGKRKKQTQLSSSPSVEYWAAVSEDPVLFIEKAASSVIRPENDLGAVAVANKGNCRLFRYPDAALSIVVLIKYGQESPAETVLTAPYVRGETALDMMITEVLPYDGNSEALARAEWNGISLEFYIQRYFQDSGVFVPETEHRITLSGLAILLEEMDTEKLKLKPRGSGVYEIAGKIEGIRRFSFFGTRFYLFLIDVLGKKNGEQLRIPVCAAEHRIQGKTPRKGHFITGMIWLQGAIHGDPFPGALDLLKPKEGEKRWKTPFGLVSFSKGQGYRWYSGSFDETSGMSLVIMGPLNLENGVGVLGTDGDRKTISLPNQDFESLRTHLPYFKKAKVFHMEILKDPLIDFGPEPILPARQAKKGRSAEKAKKEKPGKKARPPKVRAKPGKAPRRS